MVLEICLLVLFIMKRQLPGIGSQSPMRPGNRGAKASRGQLGPDAGGAVSRNKKAGQQSSRQNKNESQFSRSKKGQKQRSEIRRDFKAPERKTQSDPLRRHLGNNKMSSNSSNNLELKPRKAGFGYAYLYSPRTSLNPSLDYAKISPKLRNRKPTPAPSQQEKRASEPKPRSTRTIPKPGRKRAPLVEQIEIEAQPPNTKADTKLSSKSEVAEEPTYSKEIVSVPKPESSEIAVSENLEKEEAFFPDFDEE